MTLRPAEQPWQFKVFPLLAMIGMLLILISFLIGIGTLTPTATDYWGSNAKITRDCNAVDTNAETDFDAANGLIAKCSEQTISVSGLSDQLVTLTSTNRWKLPMTFVGVAAFMVGIALAFSSIPALLKNRGEVMAVAYEHITNAS